MKKITISDVNKKHLRIIAYLVGTWAVGLVVAYLAKDERLIGLIPVANYIIYALELEKNKSGYREALKN